MGFAAYFLIVADFINWAKDSGIPVGPGRGSAAGSIVAYVMGMVGPERARFISAMSDNDLSASIALLAGAPLLTEQEQHAPA